MPRSNGRQREVTIPHDYYYKKHMFMHGTSLHKHTHTHTHTLTHTHTHTHTHSHSLTQRSVGGAAGVMQRRLEELEAAIKKLEEDKAEMKQENASLVREREERERERERDCVCVCVCHVRALTG